MPDRERKRAPDDRSNILKGSLPKSPSAHMGLIINVILFAVNSASVMKDTESTFEGG